MWNSASSKQHFLASENYHKCGMFLQTMPKRGWRHVGESPTRLGPPPPPRLTIEKGKREPQHPGSPPPPPPPPPLPLWLVVVVVWRVIAWRATKQQYSQQQRRIDDQKGGKRIYRGRISPQVNACTFTSRNRSETFREESWSNLGIIKFNLTRFFPKKKYQYSLGYL